jgi:dipeptidase E
MKLFLSGGGSGKDSFELDKKFIEAVDISKPVLYIPIAINSIKHPYPGCLEWIKSNFAPFGFTNFVMWTEEDLKNKKVGDFEQFGGIYIGGGNTFKLLSEFKKFGTFEILKSLVEKNIPIYGGSAGAVILARTIIPALSADSNDINVTDFFALNLLKDNDIWCHYEPSMDKYIISFQEEHNLNKIIALSEDAGLFVSEKGIETVGPNVVTVFEKNKTKIFNPGKLIK